MNNITLKEIEAFVLNKKQFEINAAMKDHIPALMFSAPKLGPTTGRWQ